MTAYPPGPKGVPLLGTMLAYRRDPLGYVMTTAQEFGDVVHSRLGLNHVFMFKHPDHIKDIFVTHQHSFVKGKGIQWAKLFLGEGLLTSEGDFHTRQRRLAQPAFHRQRIGSYARVMAEYAARSRSRWRDGEELDLAREMMTLTLAVAGKTLFDADTDAEAAGVGESISAIVELFPRFALPFFGLVHKLPLPSNRRFERAVHHLDAIVFRIIEDRRREGGDRGDLLSMLMSARDVEGDGSGMSDRQLRDEVMTLLLAGHETTANALSWTWAALAQNPDAETLLHDEVDRVLGGRLPTQDDLPHLVVTERVLAESMRLRPPAWGVGRRVAKEVTIGGVTVPAGALVAVYPYVTHRDPRFWPDPERFDPDRFTPEAKAARPRFAYFPFGGGARQCIGEPFAWMEGVLLLATIAQQWRFRLVPGHPLVPQPLITLRPKHGVRVKAERRTDN